MSDIAFYLFSAVAAGGALGVIISGNYFNSAMSMLVSILGIAGLFIHMEAYLLGLIMVMVYAGAIMVLFIFITMLVGDASPKATLVARLKLLALWLLMSALVGFSAPYVSDFYSSKEVADAARDVGALAEAKSYGMILFSKFMLCVQIAGAMLLAAMVGVVAIAKDRTITRAFKRDMV